MSGRLIIEYREGGRLTRLERPVGPDWESFTKVAGADRTELAKALDSATTELLDAAHPKETR
jgi:hypothetical protein